MFNKPKKETTTYGIIGLEDLDTPWRRSLHPPAPSFSSWSGTRKRSGKSGNYRKCLVVKTLDRKSLQESGIQNCDVAVVCIGEQMDISILTTLNLVRLGIPKVSPRPPA